MISIAGTTSTSRSVRAWALAEEQHGILARTQLLALGFTRAAIAHRIEKGRLHPVMRGVYAVGWPQMTNERRWMAAVLACGEAAVLSHRSAAALWEIGKEWRGQAEVSVRQPSAPRSRAAIHTRKRLSLQPEDIVRHKGIPVTAPARTLVDIATELGPAALERAVNEADKRDLIDPEALGVELDRFAGEPGVKPLRSILGWHTFHLSDSELERLFRPIAASAGLPPPLTKSRVNGFEVDFYWPQLGLVVETDGLRYHRTPASQARDRLRDQAHTAAGLTALRFTYRQVKHEDAYVRAVLGETLRRLRPRAA